MNVPSPPGARSGLEWQSLDGTKNLPERNPDCLRTMAVDLETMITKSGEAVSLGREAAKVIKRALFDLADRIEAD